MSGRERLSVVSLLALAACGNGTAKDEPNAELPEESSVPGFVDSPVVAFGLLSVGAAAAQSDPNACVFGAQSEISDDEARALRFDVDADYPLLESEVMSDVLVSRDDVSRTKAHVLGHVDHVWRLDRSPPAGVAFDAARPPGCPPVVVYDMTVQMFTEDESISGVFAARATATTLGSAPVLNVYSDSDLRNFRGNLPVARDSTRPFFATAEVQWSSTSDGEVAFNFQPHVLYQDSDESCVEPLCPAASASQLAPLSFGVATISEMAPFAELVDSVSKPIVSSLSELVATMGPYRPDVRLWVVASSDKPSSVQVNVQIDGKDVESAPLTLTHDPQILTDGAVGGWLDFGELDESVPVEFEVQNAAALSDVRANIVIGGCVVDSAGDHCAEPGCVVRSAVSVSPAVCLLN